MLVLKVKTGVSKIGLVNLVLLVQPTKNLVDHKKNEHVENERKVPEDWEGYQPAN